MKATDISCSIILIGTELTEGRIADKNGMFLASEMKRRSIPVRKIVSMPDDPHVIIEEIRRSAKLDSVVFVSGGLGPTSDDITRDAVATAAGVRLVSSDECVRHLKARGIGSAWKANMRQALIPEGFRVLPNPNGTACGFWGTAGAIIVSMPGPPRELQPMFTDSVADILAQHFRLDRPPEMCFSMFLIPESVLEEALVEAGNPAVTWSTRVEEHRIVVTLRGDNPEDLVHVHAHLEDTFGSLRVVPGEKEVAEVFSEELRSRGNTAVFVESCTGGLAAKLMTDIPGSSDVFWGSLVTYRDGAKQSVLGIDGHRLSEMGAVSQDVVADMCNGALTRSDADLTVAITGYAGPAGEDDRLPVGTVWIGVLVRGATVQTRKFSFPGGRDRIRRMSAVAALLMGKSVLEKEGRLDSNGKWGYS